MRIPIRDIGTSKGIIIPAPIIKEYNMVGELELKPLEDGLMLYPTNTIREGWAEASAAVAAADETLLIDDVFVDETCNDWQWEEEK